MRLSWSYLKLKGHFDKWVEGNRVPYTSLSHQFFYLSLLAEMETFQFQPCRFERKCRPKIR